MAYATINGIRIHYQTCGTGEPLLLLHGLGSSSKDWEYQLPAFAQRFRVIAPCLRGFGRSAKPLGPYSVKQYADDARALLAHLGLARAHVMGYSMGGAIAFQLGVDDPHCVERLVVVNSQPSFELDHWRKHLMIITRVGMANLLGMQRMTRYVAKRLFPAPEQKPLREKMLKRHGENHRPSYLAALQALAGWSVVDRLDALHMPVLVVAAEHDYSPLHEKQRYTEALPRGRLHVVKGSRHGTPFDNPEEFNRIALEFLRGENAALQPLPMHIPDERKDESRL